MSKTTTIYVRRLPGQPLRIRHKPPPKRQRNRWNAVEVTHVKCLEDFAGNSLQEGFWSDLWKDDLGNEYVHFGGWDFYINRPRHRPPKRVPRWASRPEVGSRAENMEDYRFERFNQGCRPLPPKELVLTYRPRSLDQLRVLLRVNGPLIGDCCMITRDWTLEERKAMQKHIQTIGPVPISVFGWQPFETTDGRLRVDKIEHSNRYVYESLYEVSRDSRVWFYTPNFALVLRALHKHIYESRT